MTTNLTATEQANRTAALAINAAANAVDTKAELAAIHAAGTAKPATVTTAAAKPADAPKPATPVTATPAAPSAPTVTAAAAKPTVLPDLTAKPATAGQGGTVAAAKSKPTPKPTVTAKGKGKGNTDTKPAADDGGNGMVCGYDLTKWPKWLDAIKPDRACILAARANGRYDPITSNELANAVYFKMGSDPKLYGLYNVFDVGFGISKVRNTRPDNKQNAGLGLRAEGWVLLEQQFRVPFKNPEQTGNAGGRVAYWHKLWLTDENGKVTREVKREKRLAVYQYLINNGCKVPAWLMHPADIAQHGDMLAK